VESIPVTALSEMDSEPATPLENSEAVKLAATVSEHSDLIAKCYDRSPITEHPEQILLGFRLRSEGKVRSITLVPPELAYSEFGKCVALGYQAVNFGRQTRELKFHVPIQLEGILRAHGRLR
jgi:hypothetical protein